MFTRVPKYEQLTSVEKELYHFEKEKYNATARLGAHVYSYTIRNMEQYLETYDEKDDPLWKKYLDKAALLDARMVDQLNKIVYALLVYVGYFFLPS